MNENGSDSRDYTNPPCERSSAFWFLNALIYHNYRSVRICISIFFLCADDRYQYYASRRFGRSAQVTHISI